MRIHYLILLCNKSNRQITVLFSYGILDGSSKLGIHVKESYCSKAIRNNLLNYTMGITKRWSLGLCFARKRICPNEDVLSKFPFTIDKLHWHLVGRVEPKSSSSYLQVVRTISVFGTKPSGRLFGN